MNIFFKMVYAIRSSHSSLSSYIFSYLVIWEFSILFLGGGGPSIFTPCFLSCPYWITWKTSISEAIKWMVKHIYIFPNELKDSGLKVINYINAHSFRVRKNSLHLTSAFKFQNIRNVSIVRTRSSGSPFHHMIQITNVTWYM